VRVCWLRNLCINPLIIHFLVQKIYVNREKKNFVNKEKKERKNVSVRRCGDGGYSSWGCINSEAGSAIKLPKVRSRYRNVIQITYMYVPSSYATLSTKQNAVFTFSKYILENDNSHVTYISRIWLHVSGTSCNHGQALHGIWIFREKWPPLMLMYEWTIKINLKGTKCGHAAFRFKKMLVMLLSYNEVLHTDWN
jgi:hypothetical protein